MHVQTKLLGNGLVLSDQGKFGFGSEVAGVEGLDLGSQSGNRIRIVFPIKGNVPNVDGVVAIARNGFDGSVPDFPRSGLEFLGRSHLVNRGDDSREDDCHPGQDC